MCRKAGDLDFRVRCPGCGARARVYKKCRDGVTRCAECRACEKRFRFGVDFKIKQKTGG
jgi:hypothetical protein